MFVSVYFFSFFQISLVSVLIQFSPSMIAAYCACLLCLLCLWMLGLVVLSCQIYFLVSCIIFFLPSHLHPLANQPSVPCSVINLSNIYKLILSSFLLVPPVITCYLPNFFPVFPVGIFLGFVVFVLLGLPVVFISVSFFYYYYFFY